MISVTNFDGNANNGSNTGDFYWNLNYDSSNANQNIGAHVTICFKNNHQIYPIKKRRIDFLGYRFDNKTTRLRKRIAKNFKRTARKYNSGEIQKAKGIASYYGWFKHSDSWDLWNKYVKDFKQVKKHCK